MNKSSQGFKDAIRLYLEKRASEDELFAVTFAKENKNLDECINYILSAVQKSGVNGFADDEIYSMAVHYYDEDDIEIGSIPNNMRVVVNYTVELTDEEMEKAKQDAIDKFQRDCIAKMTAKKPKSEKAKPEVVEQPNLFDE